MKTILLILFFSTMIYISKRQVLLFYAKDGITLKDRQLDLLKKHTSGLQDRDIDIHTYNMDDAGAEVKKWHIPATATFTFILVGKDGGEKLRTDTLVSTEQLFSNIDAMPMRKREMKHNK